jgi:hypothetical protein
MQVADTRLARAFRLADSGAPEAVLSAALVARLPRCPELCLLRASGDVGETSYAAFGEDELATVITSQLAEIVVDQGAGGPPLA